MRSLRSALAVAALAALAACSEQPSKEEIEAANNTFICFAGDERLVIRFDEGEARMLVGGGQRVTLYQIASASGVRFSNGDMELHGKGASLTLVRDGVATPLDGCHNPPLKQ